MTHLHTLTATRHEFGCDPGMSGIDLFLRDGGYVTLQTDFEEARRVLAKTHCNLLRLVFDDGERLALVGGWPHPWHSFRLSFNEVAPDEDVRLHSRVTLASVPQRSVQGAWALVKETPWVRLQGPAGSVSVPLKAHFADSSADEFCAGSLRVPSGVRLVSPRDQVLFRLDAPSDLRQEVAHA